MSPRHVALWLAIAGCASPAGSPALTRLTTSFESVVVVTGVELAVDTNGRALAVVSTTDQQLLVLEERDGTLVERGWPRGLDTVLDMPSVATGPGGIAAVALRAGRDGAMGDVVVTRRSSDGTWSAPARNDVSSFAPRAYEPRVLFDASGGLLLVTNQGAAGRDGYGVAVSHASSVDAPFDRPRDADDVISPPVFFSNSPRPVVDAHGNAIITWYQSLGGPLRVLFAERIGETGAFTHGDEASALSVETTAVDSSGPPDPAMNDDGAFAVAWGQEDGHGGVAVYVARRLPGRAIERPSLDQRLSVGDGTARAMHARVAPDGTVLVAWSERTTRERVYLGVIAPDAATTDARVTLVSDRAADAFAPALAVSPEGRVAIAFVEQTSVGTRLVVRRDASDGVLGDSEVLAEAAQVTAPALAFGARRLVVAWIQDGVLECAATP